MSDIIVPVSFPQRIEKASIYVESMTSPIDCPASDRHNSDTYRKKNVNKPFIIEPRPVFAVALGRFTQFLAGFW
ncbi:MAG: hypothetical protein COA91_07285 [Robiginitomaculum sp.]|nr:MAG: hypothetical protein COA91_07285 [Robiginitomaculum sp.]